MTMKPQVRQALWAAGGLLTLVVVISVRTSPERSTVSDLEPPLPRMIGSNHWAIPKTAKKRYFEDLERLNREILLKPILSKEPDRITELRIARISDNSPMYAAGFRVADEILSVNGRPVTTLSQSISLAHEIESSNSVTVQIRRDGLPLEYRFDFE